MNIYQRVTLVLGAIAAVLMFLTADARGFLGRLALVLSVTGLVWFALRGVRFNTIDWARFRTRTRCVYLIIWSGWLVFGLLWIPLQSEYGRRDILSRRDQVMNRYPELRRLTHETMQAFIYTSRDEQDMMLRDAGFEPEVREGLERIRRLRGEDRSLMGYYIPSGFAGTYREYWLSFLTLLVLIPAGLYVLPRAILAMAGGVGK